MEKVTTYSTIINEVRREKGLTVEDMERITLTQNITQIEAGTEKLNDMQINLFANVLGLSAEALKQGIRKDRKDVAGYLDVFKRQLQDAQTSEAYFLSAIQNVKARPFCCPISGSV
jgi:transcriptional regulator with XRE-family HTH domain